MIRHTEERKNSFSKPFLEEQLRERERESEERKGAKANLSPGKEGGKERNEKNAISTLAPTSASCFADSHRKRRPI